MQDEAAALTQMLAPQRVAAAGVECGDRAVDTDRVEFAVGISRCEAHAGRVGAFADALVP